MSESRTKIVCLPASVLISRILGQTEYGDPGLSDFDILYFPDPFWDSCQVAILYTLLRKLLRYRSSLKLVIHSRTPNALALANYFSPNNLIDREHNIFPQQLGVARDSAPKRPQVEKASAKKTSPLDNAESAEDPLDSTDSEADERPASGKKGEYVEEDPVFGKVVHRQRVRHGGAAPAEPRQPAKPFVNRPEPTLADLLQSSDEDERESDTARRPKGSEQMEHRRVSSGHSEKGRKAEVEMSSTSRRKRRAREESGTSESESEDDRRRRKKHKKERRRRHRDEEDDGDKDRRRRRRVRDGDGESDKDRRRRRRHIDGDDESDRERRRRRRRRHERRKEVSSSLSSEEPRHRRRKRRDDDRDRDDRSAGGREESGFLLPRDAKLPTSPPGRFTSSSMHGSVMEKSISTLAEGGDMLPPPETWMSPFAVPTSLNVPERGGVGVYVANAFYEGDVGHASNPLGVNLYFQDEPSDNYIQDAVDTGE